MGEKSEQKKAYILKKAREVFAEKGFCSVTMKDIVEASEISRGGLYLYFENTEEIFKAILTSEDEGNDNAGTLSEDATMPELLLLFLKEQKKQILRKKKDITIAAYEYLFHNKPEKKEDNPVRSQFEAGVKILTRMIEEGIARGEFYEVNPGAEAVNIMYVLEGMKICARTMGLSESRADRELLYIMEGLVAEEE